MEVTMIEKHQAFKKSSTLAIRPFIDNVSPNMGLEKYQMVVFEGVFHEEPVTCLEYNGIRRYITGLNEFAPEIKELPEEEREAAIKQIRVTVSQLEKELAANVVDPNDPEFWNKIKLLRPDNDEFWGKITLRLGNEPLYLEPATDPYDLIKLRAIEANGFSLVGKNLESARNSSVPPKFYLDKLEDTVQVRTEVKKMRNKALAELQKLYDKNVNKLFLIAKVLDPNSMQYKKSTPNDIIYDNMDKYINGESVEKNKRQTAQRFLDMAALDMETLKLRALVKDANFYKVITIKADGYIYHVKSNAMLGKTTADVVEYLKNPLNEDILTDVTKSVEQYWK